MQASYFNQVHWNNSVNNIFEEYAAVMPALLGRTVKHYQQIDSQRLSPCANPEKKDWKATVKKIAIFVSHFTLIIPIVMYTGKWICRKVSPLHIVSPAALDPKNQQHIPVAEEIRKLREDSHYIPKECQRARFPLRLHLPVDSIVQEVDPAMKENIFNVFCGQPLNTELEAKRQKILAEGFNNFMAHGIDQYKGGVRNLLNAMVEGVLRAPYMGRLEDGMPEYVAGPHGPYYVILNSSIWNDYQAIMRNGLWSEEAQAAYLVPQESDRTFLEKGLSKAVERGYIIEEEKQRCLRKVITYDDFIQLPESIRHSVSKLRNWLDHK